MLYCLCCASQDEMRHGLSYFQQTIMDMVPNSQHINCWSQGCCVHVEACFGHKLKCSSTA